MVIKADVGNDNKVRKMVDYVVTCLSLPPTITFVKTAEKYNYWAKHIFGFNWATDDMLVKACGEAAKNYIGLNFVGAWWDDSPGIKLAREIAQKYNRTDISLTSLYINGIGVSWLFGEAFKRAGKDLTPDSLKAALETLKEYSTGGVFPPVTYTSKSHAPGEMVKFFNADVANKRLMGITLQLSHNFGQIPSNSLLLKGRTRRHPPLVSFPC